MKNAHHPADQKQVFDRACGLREMSNELFFRVFFITLNVFFAKGLDTNYLDSQGNNGLYDALEAANKIQHHSKPHGKVSQICPVNLIRKGQIIKTNDSIRAGARFLDTPSVGTVKECHEICCNLLGCNTAIVKVINSSKVSCYLFDCGIVPKCSFDAHKDYKVIELNYQTKNVDSASNQSDELVLKNVSHVVKKPGIICQPGYHAVGNDCRENCSNEFYFECSNIDRPAFKQCIATYDKCDGYQQCDDNSDEINCPLNEERATARSTSQIPRVRSTTLTEHNSSPIQINTLPVTSTSLSTSAPSLMKSFSFKFIELSKFSKHRVEDFKGGAVLVLSLGIGLVIVSLAVFICQLQKFRKYGRNRKAKNMDGDSDYLINGLYL